MATATSETRWMKRADVAERLDVSPRAVPALVAKGLIRTRNLPVRARYCAEDVERLAREGVGGAK